MWKKIVTEKKAEKTLRMINYVENILGNIETSVRYSNANTSKAQI